MKSFQYTIKDELGIHARPAGALVKLAKASGSSMTMTKGEKTVDVSRLMALMGLGVKCGDEITVTAEGGDEDAAIAEVKKFVEENL
ncbi:HPr family phosphocarrier protein [Ruminococcus sp. 5_1_39BFAA]|uniref:HPr family phosphocarrier protein n=1 Tax=Ruminococcus sp. 5_1_39BFAA TaxID=457412 RepID=UPI003566FEB9